MRKNSNLTLFDIQVKVLSIVSKDIEQKQNDDEIILFYLMLYVQGKQLRSCRDGQLS